MPASSRQYLAAAAGKPMWCFVREKRSSSAQATISPSRSSAAAASPIVVKPRTVTGPLIGEGHGP